MTLRDPNNPKTKNDIPYDAIPRIQSAAARIASVPYSQIRQPGGIPDAAKARAAIVMAFVDGNFRYDDIADAVHYDRSTVSMTRKRWGDGTPARTQTAIYAETKRLIGEALEPPAAKPNTIFAQPGQWTRPMRRRCPTGAQRMAEHQAQENRRAMIRRMEYGE